jgi:peptide/nickel transport system ATP-binding protein/oligopeptide transport system ATP-binding protein
VSEILLEVKNLRTTFHTYDGEVRAADGIDLSVCKGEILGIVGESGCGKSVTSLSMMRLIPSPPGEVSADKMELNGVELQTLTDTQMLQVRGNEISMIFQEPMSSLNPVFTVGDQIIEAIILHQKMNKADARNKAIEMLDLVQIPSPDKRIDDYPHQMSGGMRQRAMIAMALACEPALLIADEPTTALDVTIQAQILELLCQLQRDFGMSIIIITHDLGVVAEIAHRVTVMYAGVVVENADVQTLFANPLHPYTRGLLASLPRLDVQLKRLPVIPGAVPNLLNLPGGCRFHPRCPLIMDICRETEPPLLSQDHSEVRCWLYAEGVSK